MNVQSPKPKVQGPESVRSQVLWCVVAVAVLLTLIGLFWSKHRTPAATNTNVARVGAAKASGGASGAWQARSPVRFVSRPQGGTNSAEQTVAAMVHTFAQKRLAFAEKIAARRKEPLPPEIADFFKALDKGDWLEISNRWEVLAVHTHQYERSIHDRPDLEPYWPAALDAFGVAEQAHELPAQRLLDYGNAIMDSLKPGMVYVGGTDPGRWVPELLNESSDDPHIIITQNALADGSYMEFLGQLYGGQFNALTEGDTSKAFADYTADAQKRYQHDLDFPNEPKQLLPGENVSMVDGRLQITGQVAVMAINEKILQMLMAGNPSMSFALQESFPLRSTYPNALPMGPLMELNAQNDQAPFTADVAAQSVDYWRSATQALLAYPGEGDAAQNALKMYSKDVSATGNLLAAHNFTAEAEQAYQLATQVCPSSPEAVYGLANLMAKTGRADQAKALVDQFTAKYPDQAKAAPASGWAVTWTPK